MLLARLDPALELVLGLEAVERRGADLTGRRLERVRAFDGLVVLGHLSNQPENNTIKDERNCPPLR